MTPSASVVIPVKDGARHLPEVLRALARHAAGAEVLVVDSGSTDGSPALARAAGATVIEIPPGEFGHGRTRNLAAERASGELIAFLTQDATPEPGWLDAFRAAFADDRVGAAYGPHRPRPDTSPMIARELTDFFASERGEPWLSNVNACYRRACWEEVRFADLPYAEDQAFARAAVAAGWTIAFAPGAAVLHAHDYGPVGFMRRYFDEYRGLRETAGHVERLGVRSTVRDVRGLVAADRRWMREQGFGPRRTRAWTARSTLHHGSRKVFATLGSHAERLPDAVQRGISLEGRAARPASRTGPKAPVHRPQGTPSAYDAVLQHARGAVAPLLDPVPGMADAPALHVAVVIPPFRRGSGGHSTIYNLLTRLEDRGHTVSTWIHDPVGYHRDEWPAVIRGNLREFFRPTRGPVYKGFAAWYGADVALATGWDTVYPVLGLPDTRARAYLVQDHEPEFYATSAESVFAHATYGLGLHAIAASPWLRDLVHDRYGAPATAFDLGVDHDAYRPRPVARRTDTVIFYARDVTPRRGVPLGILVLEELRRRRPDTRFVLFGDDHPINAAFPYEHLGIATPEQLSWAYSEATVGLSLSLTNYSLIPQEMLACGLPVVDVAGLSLEGVFGPEGAVELAPPRITELASALERLLDDPERRAHHAEAGMAFVRGRTWDRASRQVEDGLRQALRLREQLPPAEPVPPLAVPVAAPDAWRPHARLVPTDWPATQEASDRLFARLDGADVAEVERRLDGPERAQWEQAAEAHRRTLTLVLGAWHRVPGVLEKTGLTPDEPPPTVHAMARGPLAAGGAIYYADVLADALRRAGTSMDAVRSGLDFGCSSGRVVRALAACWPDARWHGADPNADAVAWAAEHVEGAAFLVSPQDPPLPYADESFDFACAISIWSHYAEEAALRWLAEMHRVIEPGGHLVLTTHGWHSVGYYAATGERTPVQLEEIRSALYRRGFWYAAEFGDAGDWGVSHPQWGTAFLTPEWLARRALREWSLVAYGVGENAGNQDLYVLRRR